MDIYGGNIWIKGTWKILLNTPSNQHNHEHLIDILLINPCDLMKIP